MLSAFVSTGILQKPTCTAHKGLIKQTVEVQRGGEWINEKLQKGCFSENVVQHM